MKKVAFVCICPGRLELLEALALSEQKHGALSGWEVVAIVYGYSESTFREAAMKMEWYGLFADTVFAGPMKGSTEAMLKGFGVSTARGADVVLMLDDDMEITEFSDYDRYTGLALTRGAGIIQTQGPRRDSEVETFRNRAIGRDPEPADVVWTGGGWIMSRAVCLDVLARAEEERKRGNVSRIGDNYLSGIAYALGYQNFKVFRSLTIHRQGAIKATGNRLFETKQPPHLPCDIFRPGSDSVLSSEARAQHTKNRKDRGFNG